MDEIIFLGTGGARIVVFKQIRASGGLWLSLDGTNILIDPGPGSLIQCLHKNLKLDPTKLHAILLTHKHLDHSAEINVMIEAMTEGGFKKRGMVLAPQDAISGDPVVFRYLHGYINELIPLKEGGLYQIGDTSLEIPVRMKHPVETYAFTFKGGGHSISLLPDTRYFPALESTFSSDVLIINLVLLQCRDIDHLCLEDAKKIIKGNRPKVAILTHFGMSILRAKPWEMAASMGQELGIKVIAAYDRMRFNLEGL